MKNVKNLLVMTFAALLVICTGLMIKAAASAAEMKTVAAVSIADVNTLLKTVKDISAKTGGTPDAVNMFEGFLLFVDVLDTTKPLGIVVQSDGNNFQGFAFAPISDIAQIPFIQFLDLEETGPGQYELMLPNGLPIHVIQQKKWMFLTLGAELSGDLPDDPSTLLDGMNKKYILGAKINVSALPQNLMLRFLDIARLMVGSNMEENTQENFNAMLNEIEKALVQIDTIQLGLAVDPSTTDITLEAVVNVLPNTEYAEQFTEMSKMTTMSTGFFQPQGSILTTINAGTFGENQQTQLHASLDAYFTVFREGVDEQGLGEEEEALVNSLLDNLESVLNSSIDVGKFDAGFTMLNNGTVLAVAKIAEGERITDSLKQLLEAVPQNYHKYIKLEGEDYEGYKLSSFVIPLKDLGFPELPKAFANKTLTALIGVKNDSVCLGVGIDPNVTAELKKAIDGSKTEVPLPTTTFIITPGEVAKLVKSWELLELSNNVPEFVKQLVDELEKCPADATIMQTRVYTQNSVETRITASGQLIPVFAKLFQVVLENSPFSGNF